MLATHSAAVDLGFAEEILEEERWQLNSQYFPSKIGGYPAWLDLKDILGPESLACHICKEPCIFLLQLYAPGSRNSAFHRSVYLFCCHNVDCYSKPNDSSPFRVFRCQLAIANTFYPEVPPSLETPPSSFILPSDHGVTLCIVCGCKSTKTCAGCSRASYCCKAHQTIDWKNGHKQMCTTGQLPVCQYNLVSGILFPEFNLLCDEEPVGNDTNNGGDSLKIDDNASQLFDMVASNSQDHEAAGLESIARKETSEDKVFKAAKKRISREHTQVLRHQLAGSPLWLSEDHCAKEMDIPPCPYCNAARHFEFQVMPHLLSTMKVDRVGCSIDWATLVAYTCSESCSEGPAYKEEYIWKQDYSHKLLQL